MRNHVLFRLLQHLRGILEFLRRFQLHRLVYQLLIDALHLDELRGVELIFAGLLDGEAFLLAGVRILNLHGQNAVVAVLKGHFQAAVALDAAA